MKKGYAYLDKYGILHVVDGEDTAKKYSGNGKVVEIDFPFEYGYPQVKVGDKATSLIVYTEGGLREKDGLPIPNYIVELIERLK